MPREVNIVAIKDGNITKTGSNEPGILDIFNTINDSMGNLAEIASKYLGDVRLETRKLNKNILEGTKETNKRLVGLTKQIKMSNVERNIETEKSKPVDTTEFMDFATMELNKKKSAKKSRKEAKMEEDNQNILKEIEKNTKKVANAVYAGYKIATEATAIEVAEKLDKIAKKKAPTPKIDREAVSHEKIDEFISAINVKTKMTGPSERVLRDRHKEIIVSLTEISNNTGLIKKLPSALKTPKLTQKAAATEEKSHVKKEKERESLVRENKMIDMFSDMRMYLKQLAHGGGLYDDDDDLYDKKGRRRRGYDDDDDDYEFGGGGFLQSVIEYKILEGVGGMVTSLFGLGGDKDGKHGKRGRGRRDIAAGRKSLFARILGLTKGLVGAIFGAVTFLGTSKLPGISGIVSAITGGIAAAAGFVFKKLPAKIAGTAFFTSIGATLKSFVSAIFGAKAKTFLKGTVVLHALTSLGTAMHDAVKTYEKDKSWSNAIGDSLESFADSISLGLLDIKKGSGRMLIQRIDEAFKSLGDVLDDVGAGADYDPQTGKPRNTSSNVHHDAHGVPPSEKTDKLPTKAVANRQQHLSMLNKPSPFVAIPAITESDSMGKSYLDALKHQSDVLRNLPEKLAAAFPSGASGAASSTVFNTQNTSVQTHNSVTPSRKEVRNSHLMEFFPYSRYS